MANKTMSRSRKARVGTSTFREDRSSNLHPRNGAGIMPGSPDSSGEIQRGTPPSEEDAFYVEWGFASIRNNLDLINAILRQLVSLNSALLGGCLVFLGSALMSIQWRIAVSMLFFAALIVAFIGMMPFSGTIELYNAASIRQHKREAFTSKRRFLWISGSFTAAAFGAAILAIFLRYIL